MAKPAARVRKKVKKTVVDGIAHIHASFNNTITPSPIVRATP
jgi:small subunit ribosomal protein S11